MRKTIIMMILFTCLSLLYANDFNNGFSTGGMAIIETHNSGGAAEIGFPLYSSEKLSIRNYILFSGFGYETGGILAIGDKLIFGGFGRNGKRPYSFIEGNIGIYKTNGKDFLETPLYFDLKGGGGLDIYITEKMSFFVEMGGGVSFYGDEFTGMAHLGAGFRTFWN